MALQHVPASAVSIRPAGSADLCIAESLIESAGGALDPDIRTAVAEGTAGLLVAAGQVGGPSSTEREAFRVMRRAGGDPLVALMLAAVGVFVAEHEGAVVGALLTAPPVTIIQAMADRAHEEKVGDPTSAICLDLTKLAALGVVESHRRAGIGRRLVDHAVAIHRTAGFFAMYGQFDVSDLHLEKFYADAGFVVLPPVHTIDFSNRFGIPLTIAPGPHERLIGLMLPV